VDLAADPHEKQRPVAAAWPGQVCPALSVIRLAGKTKRDIHNGRAPSLTGSLRHSPKEQAAILVLWFPEASPDEEPSKISPTSHSKPAIFTEAPYGLPSGRLQFARRVAESRRHAILGRGASIGNLGFTLPCSIHIPHATIFCFGRSSNEQFPPSFKDLITFLGRHFVARHSATIVA
jgi:hypothetical protein